MKDLELEGKLPESRDEIVDEVRRIRNEYAARFDYDLNRMFADLEKRAAEHPERYANLKPVIPQGSALIDWCLDRSSSANPSPLGFAADEDGVLLTQSIRRKLARRAG